MTLKNKVKRGSTSSRAGNVPLTLEKAIDQEADPVFPQEQIDSRPTLKLGVSESVLKGIQPIQVVTEQIEQEKRDRQFQAKKREYSQRMWFYGGLAVGGVVCYACYRYYFGDIKPNIEKLSK